MKRIFFWFGSMISLVIVVVLTVTLWSRPQAPSAVAQIDADTASPSQTWEGLPPNADIFATNTAFHLWMTAEATRRTPPPTLTPSTPKVPACQFGTGIFVPAGGVLSATDELDPTQFVFGEPQEILPGVSEILDITEDGRLLVLYESGTGETQKVTLYNPANESEIMIMEHPSFTSAFWDDTLQVFKYSDVVDDGTGHFKNVYYAQAIGQAPVELFPMLGDSTLANMPRVWVDEANLVAVAKASDQQSVLAVADASAETIFIAQNPLDWEYPKSTFADADGTPVSINDFFIAKISPNQDFILFDGASLSTYLYHIPSNTVCEVAIGTHPNGERENGYFFEWSPDGRFLLLFARFNKLYVHQQIPAYPVTIDLWTGNLQSYPDGYSTADWVQGIGHLLRLEKNNRDENGYSISTQAIFQNPATDNHIIWQENTYPVIGHQWVLQNGLLYFSCPSVEHSPLNINQKQCKVQLSGGLP
jgi:hypothetical protein